MLQRGQSGDGCDLASTLCKYDLRKGDLFVLSWARVRRVRRGSLSGDVICVGHDLNWCSGWWYVCSVNVSVGERAPHCGTSVLN